jgi:hypothetical protein
VRILEGKSSTTNQRIGVGKTMDVSLENLKNVMEPKWAHFGRNRNLETSEKVLELMNSEKYRLAATGNAPMTNK